MTESTHRTPHLTTALTGPLQLLEKKILSHPKKIEDWFETQWEKYTAPIYGSVDLRNAGFKLAPVDMNLFPAGFNNLNSQFFSLIVKAAKTFFTKHFPAAKKILLIPENHTRNLFYWENIKTILSILKQAGFDTRIGSLIPLQVESFDIETITRKENHIEINNFIPDLILLNNDLSDGIPDILQNLNQTLVPPAELGWHQRLKSEHFQYYSDVTQEFSTMLEIDPWLITPLSRHCGEIDFMHHEGEECLIKNVDILFEQIKKKYAEYNIACSPYIVVKADAGTYGMAVMIVRSSDDLRSLNRKQRTRMSTSKSGQPVRRVIIQEGVYTFETWGTDNLVAEPVVYLWGEQVIGGFYRVHKDRGVDENLNSPGMHFEPLAFTDSCEHSEGCQNRFYTYGVIARLSMLAAAREMMEQKK